jgi:hypothetical protein
MGVEVELEPELELESQAMPVPGQPWPDMVLQVAILRRL